MCETIYVLSVYRYVYDTRVVSYFFFYDEDGGFAAAFFVALRYFVLF